MEPARIGRYEIRGPLGRGGMGMVYKAHDPLMDRWVAIKTITVQDAHQRERFQREVRAAGGLHHPHITIIYDVGEADDLAYIVMELVEGDTLASRLSAPVPWPEAVELLLPICQALAYAHSRGVIHRDVKPANILVSRGGQVKLTDFGVARLEVAHRLTTSTGAVGTPLYTAPEQVRNEAVDGRADLFSLGIVLFELVTGQHPFSGETLAQVVYRLTQPEPVELAPLAALVPSALVEVVGRALSKDPDARFPDATAMASTLAASLEQITALSSPRPPSPDSPLRLEYVASNLSLSPAEEGLLRTAFAGHDQLYLEREFKRGYSGARVLLVTPVRSGRRLTKVVLKFDVPAAIDREWQAYREFVADTLPPMAARIVQPPVHDEAGELALLWYTFAGELGQAVPESLREYYTRHNGEAVAALLETAVFKTFGSHWWQQRASGQFILRREYDRLLPVHLVVQAHPPAEETPRVLVAGKVNSAHCRALQWGQAAQLQDFVIVEMEAERGELTVQALPASGSLTNPIRVRVVDMPPDQVTYQLGTAVPSLSGMVVATRHDLLLQLTRPAFPDQGLNQKTLIIGGRSYPNPLYDYDSVLDHLLVSMTSIIHGDLNLENILVTPELELAWLIDFATTRQGHTLADFMRLETQVITKLLPQTGVGPAEMVRLMQTLHQPRPSPRGLSGELKKPFVVLAAIRRVARECLNNRQNWDEYYLGLVINLLGALKFKELDAPARRLALAAAAVVRGLIEAPALRTTSPVSVTPPPPERVWLKWAIGAIGLVGLILLISLGWWFWRQSASPVETTVPAQAPAVAVAPSVATTGTPTPALTSTSSPTPGPPDRGAGVVVGPLDIHAGPGLDYPVVGTVPDGTPVQVTGHSADGRWWQIAHPGGPGGYGWVLAEFVELQEIVALPIALASPPPTASATPTETSTPMPTAAATQGCLPPTFYRALPGNYPGLGCAVEAWQSDFTFQWFERGLMLWRKSPGPAEIYVLYQRGEWRSQIDPQGPPHPSCPEGEQTEGLGPIFSFGVIWCAEEIERLGLPLTGEMAFEDSPVEQFDGGLAFKLDQSGYVLFGDNHWESFPANGSNGLAEDFTSQAGFLERWESFTNGGTVAINDGFLSLASDVNDAFPYVRLRRNPFPATGDFTLDVELQYSRVGEFGTGLVLGNKLPENGSPVGTEPDPVVERFKVWQDNSFYNTFIVGTLDTIMASLKAPDIDRHHIRVVYKGGLVQTYLDGVLVGQEPETGLRPTALWFGNPYRTPEAGHWSELNIFSVLVEASPAASPETPSPPKVGVTLEDFEAFNTVSFQQAYTLNDAWGKNDLAAEVTTFAGAADVGRVLALTYNIKEAVPDNYVGFERTLSVAQDWSDFSAVQFWAYNDAAATDLIFQWGEALTRDGEVWKTRLKLELGETRVVKIVLAPQFFGRTDWSPSGNGQMDLDQVNYYAFFVERAQGSSGTIYLDAVELLPR